MTATPHRVINGITTRDARDYAQLALQAADAANLKAAQALDELPAGTPVTDCYGRPWKRAEGGTYWSCPVPQPGTGLVDTPRAVLLVMDAFGPVQLTEPETPTQEDTMHELTVTQLSAMPRRTKVIDSEGNVWFRSYGWTCEAIDVSGISSDGLVLFYGPIFPVVAA